MTSEEALEKQVPKKPISPITNWRGKVKAWRCPECGLQFGRTYKPRYCPDCGQLIDWSETDNPRFVICGRPVDDPV